MSDLDFFTVNWLRGLWGDITEDLQLQGKISQSPLYGGRGGGSYIIREQLHLAIIATAHTDSQEQVRVPSITPGDTVDTPFR